MAAVDIRMAVERYLAALPAHGVHPTNAALFGSHHRGTPGVWSDIDLIVIAPEFDGPYDHTLVAQLWRATADADTRIEPIACGTEEWTRETLRPIIDIARRDCELIRPRAAA